MTEIQFLYDYTQLYCMHSVYNLKVCIAITESVSQSIALKRKRNYTFCIEIINHFLLF